MKIMITGGAGFIGSHIVDAYIEAGHDVIVVDNLTTGTKEFLHKRARFYECDIISDELLAIFEKELPDVVSHHAAQMNVRVSLEKPVVDANVNILGLLNVLQCSVASGVKKFLFISSGGAVYGDTLQIPTSEEVVPCPLSPYGLAKYVGEQYIQLFHRLHGLNYSILRYGNVYGPRQNPYGEAGVIAIFIAKMLAGQQPTILGDGEQTRDYVYVQDIVTANLLALEKGDHAIFNLGTGKETSVITLFALLQKQLDFQNVALYSDKNQGEVSRNALDCARAKEGLGWVPEHDLQMGLEKTIAWFKARDGAQ
jgi:UDP-glucose 4-epimerase